MVSYKRVKRAEELLACGLWALYERAFPREERRSWEQHCRAMEEESVFRCLSLSDDGEVVGLMFCWELTGCLFIEHFAIDESKRGRGLGQAALRLLQQECKLIILEIELPEDEVTCRRLRFYRAAGFVLLPYEHVQRPFHADTSALSMKLLSWPTVAPAGVVHDFEVELAGRVMQYSGATTISY